MELQNLFCAHRVKSYFTDMVYDGQTDEKTICPLDGEDIMKVRQRLDAPIPVSIVGGEDMGYSYG